MLNEFKAFLREILPFSIFNLLRILKNWKDFFSIVNFFLDDTLNATLVNKLKIIKQLYVIDFNIDSMHTETEILAVIRTILSLSKKQPGVIVEAGCFKGGSTAKLSLAADIAGRNLIVFDSFEGIPANEEPPSKDIFGGRVNLKKGDCCGTVEEVKSNVTRFGEIDTCRFVKGWFNDTMPVFKEPISTIFLDVDLASSTRTCLKYLFPLLEKGGILYSQDAHLPLVMDVFNDNRFWLMEVGCEKPKIQGLGKERFIKVKKRN